MKGMLCGLLALLAVGGAVAQDPKAPMRIPVRHADPWTIKAMLEGVPLRSPETSTLPGFAGVMGNATNAANRFLKDGILVVNPTDNSLWYFPGK
ncbi:hypothetical protein [Fimbriimonas ginsengisoli]|uniref:Uncharacterized protein n=1 Tax=Fimbriimonas ginsengisoli Gsoil 348 TaxID=661478 RepID=A0A068NKW5_FIMGI|nr:hypothetical protein [Fimbriimonas ginsengisoli]AIE83435.1 hypothetical protein OP10G_0067 [Fimbriimonas ginsengisoli Gsoil 348]